MQKYTAIILASRDANEVNRIYFLYTLERGLVRAAAKGVRKPEAKLAGHLEPGTLSEVYIAKTRGLGQITSAITLDSFENVKKNFEKISEFLKISRFFLKNFAEEERDEKIFELLKEFFGLLDYDPSLALPLPRGGKSKLSPPCQGGDEEGVGGGVGEVLTEAFWWKLFDFLGHRPEVMRCTACGQKLSANSKKIFNIEKGGVVCAKCGKNFRNSVPVSDNQIKLLRVFLGNSLKKIVKVKADEAELQKLAKIRENFGRYNF
jgi:DNA repair protein RecO (recombination protein O)